MSKSADKNGTYPKPIVSKRRVVVHKNAVNFWFRKKYDINWHNWDVTPVKKAYIVVGSSRPFTTEFFIDKL